MNWTGAMPWLVERAAGRVQPFGPHEEFGDADAATGWSCGRAGGGSGTAAGSAGVTWVGPGAGTVAASVSHVSTAGPKVSQSVPPIVPSTSTRAKA
jgi:hypothetical protein